MDDALPDRMTLAEFLAWEPAQDQGYEFDGTRPVPMPGRTAARSAIGANLFLALDARLRNPCQAFRSELRVIAQDRVRSPDVVVTCSAVAQDASAAPDPVAVFEVLPAGAARADGMLRAAEYQAMPSVQHCVLLEQARAEAAVLTRAAGGWAEERAAGHDAVLRLPALGVRLPLAELYSGVRLSG